MKSVNRFQLLPLQPDPRPAEVPPAVLLAFADLARLPAVVAELLRLGAVHPQINWPAGGLLRVARPPLATLLRAGRGEGLTVYREQAPGVWVERGHAHPLADRIPVPADRLLLLRPPGEWDWKSAGPFAPLELPADAILPPQPVTRTDVDAPSARVQVALRLRPTRTDDAPELWVLRDRPLEQLAELARTADDRLIAQLSLAVVRTAGRLTAVLHGRSSRHRLPEVVLPGASAYRRHLRLPNLFVPAGTRLAPPLRRDAIRQALAADAAALTWVEPGAAWTGLPFAAFRPLAESVEYLVQPPRAGRPWTAGPDLFAPGAFVLHEELARARAEDSELLDDNPEEDTPSPRRPAVTVVRGTVPRPPAPPPPPAVRPPPVPRADALAQLRQQLRDLEQRFRAVEGPADAPERLALWPDLARLSAALAQTADAALCWLAALWAGDDPGWPGEWLAAEAPDDDNPLDRLLDATEPPTAADLRAFAAAVVAATGEPILARALRARPGEVAAFLERHEELLPVRAAWLAWLGLVRHSSGDTLTLARARDRLLGRLLESGLSATRDLPGFLRMPAAGGAGRERIDRSTLLGLRDLARRVPGPAVTAAVIDLTFAYALARLGERTAAEPLLAAARKTPGLEKPDGWLVRAYAARVEQAFANQPPGGPLPGPLVSERERLSDADRARVDRYRQVSQILEPFERVDPFRHQRPIRTGALARELADLAEVSDPAALARGFERLHRANPTPAARLPIATAALRAAPRAGETFARDALDRAGHALDADATTVAPDLFRHIDTLEAALLAAGHFGENDRIPGLLERLFRVLGPLRGERAAWVVGRVSGQVFRTLGRLGLRDEAARLAAAMADAVLEGGDLAALAGRPAVNWPVVLRALVTVAAGWFYLGREAAAVAVLDELRRRILTHDLRAEDELDLAVGYADLLGRAAAEVALPRMEELLGELPALQASGDRPDYLLPAVRVTEATVLALLREDFAVGSAVRRWLDEDEDLVRRRIHRDLRAALDAAGV
jgi:hypothetical protein